MARQADQNEPRVGAALVLESKIAEILIFADEDTPFRGCQGDHLVVGGTRTQVGGGYHVVPCCPQRLSYDRRHVLVDQKPHRATRPLQPAARPESGRTRWRR